MDRLLEKVLAQNSLDGARMVGSAVRTRYYGDSERVMAALAAWTEHPHALVRVAAGVALGTITVRNPDSLPEVMPYVERLANDQDSTVREHGAVGALETVWLYHYDSIWIVMEDWIERKNDLVRRVAIETMGRIVRGSMINKPSTLKQFIEKGMTIIDGLIQTGNPALRLALAAAVNDFGLRAGDLISPQVLEWSSRTDLSSLALVKDLLELPFGERCRGLDREDVLARVAEIEAGKIQEVAGWLRGGSGQVEYSTLLVDRLITSEDGDRLRHWADPYRGCQYRCEFCSTRALSEFTGDSEENLVRRIVVVANAAEILARELADESRADLRDRSVRVGMRADPYQPAEAKFQITRDMLKVFLEAENPVSVQTRSDGILRDLDVLEKLAEKGLVNALISVPTPIEGIRKKVEPGVAAVTERFRTIALLAKRGVPVGLVVSPVLPHLTDHAEAIEEVIRRGAEAGAAFVIPEVLTLDGTGGTKFRYFLESFIPALQPKYDALYDRDDGKLAEYVKRICGELVPELAEKYGANRTGLMLGAEAEVAL
jgi:DNA repair photolyase